MQNLKLLFVSCPHHSFASFDFLDDSFHIKVSKFGPWRGGQLYRPRWKKLKQIRDYMQAGGTLKAHPQITLQTQILTMHL